MYVKDIQSGTCDAKATPKILKETAATAWVDGKNGLGAVVGNFCMDLAIKKAKESGVGWVTAKGHQRSTFQFIYQFLIVFNLYRIQSLWYSGDVHHESHQ